MESGEGEEVNIEELASNLSTYKEQLQQVRKLLNDDPRNSEFLDMEKELMEDILYIFLREKCTPGVQKCENLKNYGVREFIKVPITCVLIPLQVIELTEELLATTKESDGNLVLGTGTGGVASPNLHLSGSSSNLFFNLPSFSSCFGTGKKKRTPFNLITLDLLSRKSRPTADYDDKFPVGTKVQAVWSEDGEWYNGTVEALTPNGYYIRYDGWGNREEVDPDNVRPIQEGTPDPLLEAEKVAVATKEALKRKIAQAASKDFESWTVPQKLQIDPNDPEDVKATKKKKIHAFKSKMRLEEKEVTQNKRQNAWQQFQTTKGRAKKIGFFSGRKRESIFKSPEDPFGKVGVTGSGKGLTEFQRREKHLHLKGANGENIEAADD
ncbi:hypothetical protein ACJIZ3_001036 [Penstemon smallii]|uniref:Tudor domain-containing protein n=1 Tax=Penstemon smallii TaxID=265156 RepID=A0ABD3U607_9LAMI